MASMKPQPQQGAQSENIPQEVVEAFQVMSQLIKPEEIKQVIGQGEKAGATIGQMALQLFQAVKAHLAKEGKKLPEGDFEKALIERAVKMIVVSVGDGMDQEAMFGLYGDGLQVALGQFMADQVAEGKTTEEEIVQQAGGREAVNALMGAGGQ